LGLNPFAPLLLFGIGQQARFQFGGHVGKLLCQLWH
jgi:hypothetical protein